MSKKTVIYLLITLFHCFSALAMEEMAVMMGAQMGATVANEAINATFKNMGKAIQQDQSNLQNSMKEFSGDIKNALQKDSKALGKVFEGAIKHVGSQKSNQFKQMEQMQEYIFKMISLHKAQAYYILPAPNKGEIPPSIIFDQAFAHGTMYTPEGPIWKNIFTIGNWEYDPTTNSFWQLKNEPVFTFSINSTTNTQQKSSSKAAYNSIFTEYFINADSYEIKAEITLYQLHYPFFAGIIFNKNRWISGTGDSLTKCRLVGIYGNSDSTVGTYFAEQYTKTTKAKKQDVKNKDTINEKTFYPLEQIVNNEVKPKTTLPSSLFDDLYNKPPTFIIRIITSPKKVSFKIWPKTEKEPDEFISVSNLSSDLYLYHGIGFMSPGTIAEFKLHKPQDLLFSSNAQKKFQQDVKELIANQAKG